MAPPLTSIARARRVESNIGLRGLDLSYTHAWPWPPTGAVSDASVCHLRLPASSRARCVEENFAKLAGLWPFWRSTMYFANTNSRRAFRPGVLVGVPLDGHAACSCRRLAQLAVWLRKRLPRRCARVTAAPILVFGLFSLAASVSERPVARLHLGHACCLPV